MIELSTIINGRYRVDRQIGSGGMAVVYRGHDLLLGRDVAIKALRPQYASDSALRSRFEREARAAASFAHPNIIAIYDVGEEGDTPYIIMEYISGHTLKEIIQDEGAFHPDDVAALLTQVGAALDYAHERGYVHRDVKPQNILVDQHGVARVVDFGIAKGLGDSDLTELGTGLGTVHYLSPEQASGLMPTPASDIYSAGVVAFEMLTGRLPFPADSPVGVAMRHVHDTPPAPSTFRPGIPPAVDAIVLKALDKDPTKRFQKAGALATAMSSWREARPRGAQAVPALPPALPPEPSPVEPEPVITEPDPIIGPLPPADLAEPPPAAPATSRLASRRDEAGCATWIVGLAILLGLIGLIWFGFQLTQRFAGGGTIPTETVPGAAPSATVPAANPTTTDPAATTAPPVIAPASAIAIPDLIGMTLSEAGEAARANGFQVSALEPVFSENVPLDRVAEQDPPPAAEPGQNTTIYVKLSRGSATIDLQAMGLAGVSVGDAERVLTEAGLAVSREDVPSETVAEGLVAGTEPADRAVVGDRVVLLVSLGDVVLIPGDLQGAPLAEATTTLEDAGLVVTGDVPVGRAPIEEAGLDLDEAGIEPGDVVGVQGDGADFDTYVPRGSEIELVVYDPSLDEE